MTVRILRLVILLLLVLTTGVVLPGREGPTMEPAGKLELAGHVRILRLSGTPYEMGLRQGTLLRASIRKLVSEYLYGHLVQVSRAQHFWMLLQSQLVEPLLPVAVRSELHGIADGAGLSYRDVLLLNSVPDQLALAHTLPDSSLLRGVFAPSMPVTGSLSLCTSFVGWGGSTDHGELLLGHSLESPESDILSDHLVILVRWPETANATVGIGLAGSVGIWAGMNEQSLAVTLASSPSVDVRPVGLPLSILLRLALETNGDLDTLIGELVSADRQYGGNVIVADGKAPLAAAVELSAHEYAIFEASGQDHLARTNHFVDSELSLTQQVALEDSVRLASQARLERVTAWMARNRGWIGVDKALALLLDFDSRSGAELSDVSTLQSILLVPADASLWLATGGDGSAGTFIQLTFEDLARSGLRR